MSRGALFSTSVAVAKVKPGMLLAGMPVTGRKVVPSKTRRPSGVSSAGPTIIHTPDFLGSEPSISTHVIDDVLLMARAAIGRLGCFLNGCCFGGV